ncbi:MAG: hypothetical protein RL033_4744 [Pseudomonadota bacterium]|jgi:hypothetical protein
MLLAEAGAAMHASSEQPTNWGRGVFAAGGRIANRYVVERFIARGGMGEVYAVEDEVLNERVALKTVLGASSASRTSIRRLKTEVLLSRRIGHPNTCRIYEFGEHQLETGDVVYFFTMALVEGETLGAKVRRDGALSSAQVLVVARQILAGLAEAHALGVLHRDLKSDNVMLRTPPTPGLEIDAVIMDFGLALSLHGDARLTSDTNAIVGSLAYMAPEQVKSEKLTAATDIYAFGVILFELLTGGLPFRASSPAAAALQRLRERPPAPSTIDPKLDPAWDRIALGCLQQSTDKRFASARDVLAALAALDDAGGLPRAVRGKAAVGIVAAALCCLLALAFWGRQLVVSRLASTAAPVIATEMQAVVPAPRGHAEAPVQVPAEPSPKALTPTPAGAPPAAAVPAPQARARAQQRAATPAAQHSRKPGAPFFRDAPAATSAPSSVPPSGPRRRNPVGPLPVDAEFPE